MPDRSLDSACDGLQVDLGPGEALMARAIPPACRCAFCVYLDRWAATAGYRSARCLPGPQDLAVQPDGSRELITGLDLTGHQSQAGTPGRRRGISAIRPLLAERRSLPQLRVASADVPGRR